MLQKDYQEPSSLVQVGLSSTKTQGHNENQTSMFTYQSTKYINKIAGIYMSVFIFKKLMFWKLTSGRYRHTHILGMHMHVCVLQFIAQGKSTLD